MSGYRPAYTFEEEEKMVQYIIKKRAFHKLKGRAFWQEMESSGQFERTWQSLKEHFRKKVFPIIHYTRFKLDAKVVEKFKEGYKTAKKSLSPNESEDEESDHEAEHRVPQPHRPLAREFTVDSSTSSSDE